MRMWMVDMKEAKINSKFKNDKKEISKEEEQNFFYFIVNV